MSFDVCEWHRGVGWLNMCSVNEACCRGDTGLWPRRVFSDASIPLWNIVLGKGSLDLQF